MATERKIISSRPDDSGLEINTLTFDELELISAFLYCTRLGSGVSPYRDAAYSLMEKIVDMLGDQFMADASSNVDMVFDIIDTNGTVTRSVGHDFIEIDV